MKITMIATRIMPFGVFAAGQEYDTTIDVDLTEGQAKTFVLCGAATIPSGAAKKRKVTKNGRIADNT